MRIRAYGLGICEQAAGVVVKRKEEDIFDRQRATVEAVHFSAPLGLADMNPIGSPVASSAEAGGLDEGLQQERAHAVAGLPVLR
jgi:hypothetical protein